MFLTDRDAADDYQGRHAATFNVEAHGAADPVVRCRRVKRSYGFIFAHALSMP